MKRFIEKLMAALRAVLERFGFWSAGGSSSGSAVVDRPRGEPSCSADDAEGADASPEPEQLQEGSCNMEAAGEEPDKAIRGQSDPGAAAAPSSGAREAVASPKKEGLSDRGSGDSVQERGAVPMLHSVDGNEDSTEECVGEEIRSVIQPSCDQGDSPETGIEPIAVVQGVDLAAFRKDVSNKSNAGGLEPQATERSDDCEAPLPADGRSDEAAELAGADEENERRADEIGQGKDEVAADGEQAGSSGAAGRADEGDGNPVSIPESGFHGGRRGEALADEKASPEDQAFSDDESLQIGADENEQIATDAVSSFDAAGCEESEAERATSLDGADEERPCQHIGAADGPELSPREAIEAESIDSTLDDESALGEPPRVAAEKSLGFAEGQRAPSPRRPTPAEDADEYKVVVSDISTVDREYGRWNSAVVEQLLLAEPASEDVYLSITPRVLATACAEAGFHVLTPEEAEQRFSSAVASIYRSRVLNHSARLRVLRRCGIDGSPDCAAFLASSVLAAYHMQADEDVSGNAYYRRLADLLGCGMSGAYPVGFSTTAFESLWTFLRNWLREAQGRRLAMAGTDVGLRRFVALPLAHVPLRSLDIEKLPAFFAWAGYEPGSRISRGRLLADLRLWQQSRNALTQTGAEALLDDRSEAVLAQVSAELESWDGSYSQSVSRRSALIEIQFDVVQRRPIFAYLPRRPAGFPAVFDDGEHLFEASDEGWYDPTEIRPSDGDALTSGFEWCMTDIDRQFSLRRPEAHVIALTPSSNYSGFLSSRRLLRGIKCSVLCHHDVIGTVEEYLSEIAQQRVNVQSHPLLPEGWSIVRDITAQRDIEAPDGLEALEIDPNIGLVASGGLRIGRRWSWIAGAPPRILVTGRDADEVVKVNGAPVEVSGNGELLINGLLGQPGEYLIEAGRARRRIEVLNPQMPVQSSSGRPGRADGSRIVRVALPQGSWTLIGSSPAQVCTSRSVFMAGALASCPFHPVWAVKVGSGPGAEVAVVEEPEPPRAVDLRKLKRSEVGAYERWARIIYDAAVRRPRLIGVNGIAAGKAEELAWKKYASTAKAIKRALKRK